MRLQAKPVALVAAVAVAAVVVTTVVVVGQVPTVTADDEPVAPLSSAGVTGTPTTPGTPTAGPSTPTTPSSTPTPTGKPSGTPTSGGLTGPTVIELEPDTYRRGAAPSIPYVDQRTLIAGGTRATAKARVNAAARTSTGVLAIGSSDDGRTELQDFDDTGRLRRRVADVATVEASTDGLFSAYATQNRDAEVKGSTITWQSHKTSQTLQVRRPNDFDVRVLYVNAGFVYFSSRPSVSGDSRLYRWKLPSSVVEQVANVKNPLTLSPQGLQLAMLSSISDQGSCTAVVDATDTRIAYWRTCAFMVHSFSPKGRTVLAGAAYADGYGEGFAAVLDNSTGKVLRKWSGTVLGSAYEDEDHVLLTADDDDDKRGAIVRCSISTGDCELATPLGRGGQDARSTDQAARLP